MFIFQSLILVVILTVTVTSISWESPNYSFEQYLEDFELKINSNSPDYQIKKSIWLKELERVRNHNSMGVSWKETINKFSLTGLSDKSYSFGRSKSADLHHTPHSLRSHSSEFVLKKLSELPHSIDWREKGVVTSVKDQGHCGSCWAFTATATMESHLAINTGYLFTLSPEQFSMCSPNQNHCGGSGGCAGSTAELAFDYAANASESIGIFQEYQYSYQHYLGGETICAPQWGAFGVAASSGYVKLTENNYEELMNAVAQIGPIAVSVDASSWHAYSSGIFDGCNQQSPDINHAVTLVGYGTDNGQDYWLIRNSWSPTWGEKGYIRLARTSSEGERCGVDNTPQHGSQCDGETDPVKACGTCGVLYDSSYPTGVRIR